LSRRFPRSLERCSFLRGGGLLFPVLRQQFAQSNPRDVDLPENIVEVVEGVYAVKLTGIEDRIENSRTLCPVMGTGKEVVLPSKSDRSHLILDEVVIDLNPAVINSAVLNPAVPEILLNLERSFKKLNRTTCN